MARADQFIRIGRPRAGTKGFLLNAGAATCQASLRFLRVGVQRRMVLRLLVFHGKSSFEEDNSRRRRPVPGRLRPRLAIVRKTGSPPLIGLLEKYFTF